MRTPRFPLLLLLALAFRWSRYAFSAKMVERTDRIRPLAVRLPHSALCLRKLVLLEFCARDLGQPRLE
jgi:hypothetical protein